MDQIYPEITGDKTTRKYNINMNVFCFFNNPHGKLLGKANPYLRLKMHQFYNIPLSYHFYWGLNELHHFNHIIKALQLIVLAVFGAVD